MNAPETIREAIIQVAQSPKVAIASSTATASIGALASQSGIHGMLVDISMGAGIIVTGILGCCHMVKFAILRHELEAMRRKMADEKITEKS